MKSCLMRLYDLVSSDWFRQQVRQSTRNLRDDRVLTRLKQAMSIGLMLCVICKVLMILVQHSVNGNPHRHAYVMTHPKYEKHYFKEKIFHEETVDEEHSGLVLFIID